MALHMMIDRIRPDKPSKAPAVISSLLLSTKPMATAESPAYAFKMEITVGMSAPPIGITNIQPKFSDRTMINTKAAGDQLRSGNRITRIPSTTANAIALRLTTILAAIHPRSLRNPLDFLQLARRHKTAGERQIPQDDLGHDRGHPERGQTRTARLTIPVEILGRSHQSGRQTAERVRQRGPLRHSRQRHLRQPIADDRAGMIGRMIHQYAVMSGAEHVASTASPIATAPAKTPRRAVFGSFIQCSEKMNSAVAIR